MTDKKRVFASGVQQQFWLAQHMAPGGSAYNVCSGFIAKGAFDESRFQSCLTQIVRRHEVFRANYEMEGGQLFQVIDPDPRIELHHETVDTPVADEFAARSKELFDGQASRPFDLARDPVVRLMIVRSGSQSSGSQNSGDEKLTALLITVHHIAIDLRSKELLRKQLEELYRDGAVAESDTNVAVSYGDYCEWERDFQSSERAERMGRFWKEHLKDRTLSLPLYTDFSPPSMATQNGDLTGFRLDSDLNEKIGELSERTKTNPFVILLAGYYALLYKYTSAVDFVVGIPLTNRRQEQFKNVMGCFVNTLPLSVDIDPEAGFSKLLRSVRMGMLSAHRNQEVPIERIVSSMDLQHDASRNPLYQIGFTFEPPMGLELEGLEVERVSCNTRGAQLELFLRMWHEKDEICGQVEFNTDLFERDTAQRFGENYQALLNAAIDDLDAPLLALDAISARDEEPLMRWNQTSRSYDLLPLGTSFERQVDRTPESVALRFRGGHLTYKELDDRANQMAHFLVHHGVKKGDRVAVCMNRDIDMLVSIYGVIKAGAAYVPIEPEYPGKRIGYMLENVHPSAILSTSNWSDKLVGQGARVLFVDSREVEILKQSKARLEQEVLLSDTAYIIYTSGSTGKPKGVLNGHAGIANRLCWMQDEFGLTDRDVVLFKTPFSFDVSVWEIFWALQVGASLEIVEPGEHRDPIAISRVLSEADVTTVHFVPSMLDAFLSYESEEPPRSLKRVICSGEALSIDLRDRFFAKHPGVELHNLYGPTEAAVDVTHWQCKSGDHSYVPIGKAIANTRMYTLDPALNQTAVGVPGEICIGGVQVAQGYWDNPELTAEKFVDDPFFGGGAKLYRTGDLGVFLPTGDIRFLGRLDFQVKIRGNRIEFGEIESVLRTHPRVEEAVVVARRVGSNEQSIVAYITGGSEAPVAEIKQHVAAHLPDYMIPAFVIALDSLPLSGNGKVDRKALPEVDVSQVLAKRQHVAPACELEEELLNLWKRVLGVDDIGVQDNFMDVGGSSLLLMAVSAELTPVWCEKANLVSLLQHTTVERLAKHLSGDRAVAVSEIRQEKRERVARAKGCSQVDGAEVGDEQGKTGVAIVGMGLRIPGADTPKQLWNNLVNGVESLQSFEMDELDPAVPSRMRDEPFYVRSRGVLERADEFDAGFFGLSPLEAKVMDPQQRVFLQTVWASLEDAGCDPNSFLGMIGVFGGASTNTYFAHHVSPRVRLMRQIGDFAAGLLSEKDYLTTRVSYSLNLHGPSININTACSTSLVAVAEAYQSLLAHRCDAAIAGGVTISTPQNMGYLWREGSILSKTGHCRPFDIESDGIVPSNGAGAVVMKRLEDALESGDRIYAVIKGVGINNDGSGKLGFTAPAVATQAEAIMAAHAEAEVCPSCIGYVETHGTGTKLGDNIETEALRLAFGDIPVGTIPIGSIKSNIGHLDAAAGVAGLMKAVLCLHNKTIAPTVHFTKANPNLKLEEGPFYVSGVVEPFERGDRPRLAGVSSLGLGGTNVHLVLEEAPECEESAPAGDRQVLLLSARDNKSLARAYGELADHLEGNVEVNFDDLAFTLAQRRRHFSARGAVVCAARGDTISALRDGAETIGNKKSSPVRTRSPLFVFPGQGVQYAGMGAQLYESESVFRYSIDQCASVLLPLLGRDIRELIFASEDDAIAANAELRQTALTQPAIFAIEYALAELWKHFGVAPVAMVGHSIGEYTAACLSGVFSLKDALKLVVERGRVIQAMEPGSMLSVSMSAEDLERRLDDSLSIASVNAPGLCVASGETKVIEKLLSELTADGVAAKMLVTSHAFHSSMMETAAREFEAVFSTVVLNAPRIPFVSTATGTWISDAQACDPGYWGGQIQKPVLFSKAIGTLLENDNGVFVEVGPRNTATTLVRRHITEPDRHIAVSSMGARGDDEREVFLRAIGRYWQIGGEIDLASLVSQGPRNLLSAPGYPFERRSFWVPAVRSDYQGDELDLERVELDLSDDARDKNVVLDGLTLTSEQSFLLGSWRDLLGVTDLSIDDDFFDLGGHSLVGIALLDRVKDKYDIDLALSAFLSHSTIRKMAQKILALSAPPSGQAGDAELSEDEWTPLVSISGSGNQHAVFCVAGLGGHAMEMKLLGKYLGEDIPFYGLETRGVAGHEPHETIEEMAVENLAAIRKVQPAGPYHLCGYSVGGVIAFEMAKQLERDGEEVALLAFVDSDSPVLPKRSKLQFRKAQLKRFVRDPQGYSISALNRHFWNSGVDSRFDHVVSAVEKAFDEYRPGIYSGDATLFRTYKDDYIGDIRWTVEDSNGWKQLIGGKLDIFSVSGRHLTVVQEPENAKDLAQKMRRVILTV